jgi:multidrug efflux pump subunit AcrA (membrane-fusion protein)
MTATFVLPSGDDHGATISSIGKNDGGRVSIVLEPDPLTPEQLDELRGENVRVNIPVGATDGDVLSVPYAALTAGPGGESRVEVVVGDPRDGESAETRIVTVETGLASGGYVEVTPTEGELAEGDLVVVGS